MASGLTALALGLAGWAQAAQTPTPPTPPAPPRDCPGRNAAIVEHFFSADCSDCWAAAEAPGVGPQDWRFDWVLPTRSGSEAPLSAAALLDSAERAQRAGSKAPIGPQPGSQRRAAAPPRGLALALAVGPAWRGYFGVQAEVRGALPPGSGLWLALVETIPAGSDGSPVERALVRSVAGPLPVKPLAGQARIQHLQAMRWPESAQPERLQARGWIESADGMMLAVASPRCPLR